MLLRSLLGVINNSINILIIDGKNCFKKIIDGKKRVKDFNRTIFNTLKLIIILQNFMDKKCTVPLFFEKVDREFF